jgi:hypothetical protein
MMHLRPLLAAMIMVAALLSGTSAQARQPAFESIISKQIEAFRAGDNETAFSFAAPSLQLMFRTPDNFIAMVKRGYMAVYAPRRFSFPGTETDAQGRPVQLVEVVDGDGRVWTARYTFEQQPDGSWRIAAVTLEKAPGADV